MNEDILGEEHALITLFNESLNKKINLILVIGREPNNTNKFNDKVGKYSFEDANNSAFWNISYKKIGELIPLDVKNFKERCKKRQTSPIAYTNSLPRMIEDKNKNKSKERNKISEEELNEHIENIFSKEVIKERVKLIILSGLNKKGILEEARDKIKLKAQKLDIPLSEVPYFHGVNSKKINFNLKEEELIKRILQEWEND